MAANSPERLALLARMLKERGIEKSKRQAIPRRKNFGDPPLSYDQRRLWFLDQYEPGTSLYNDCVTLRLRGAELDVDLFSQAIQAIVDRHEVLRTWFVTAANGHPVQRVRPSLRIRLRYVDLGASAAAQREARVEEILVEDVRRPFYLDQPPLLRATLIRLEEREYEFGLTMHHIVSDGGSYGVFYRELSQIYASLCAGETPELEPLPIQYGDYAQWERETVDERRILKKIGYWRDKLRLPPTLELPVDRPRPAFTSNRGAFHRFAFSESLYASLQAFCRREGLTPYWVLLASYFAVLHRFSGQTDILIGTPSSCRNQVGLEHLIGFFVHTLALRNDLGGNPTLRELVQRTRRVALEANEHEEVPFERIVQVVRRRDESGAPLIQAWFAHMRDMIPPPRIEGARASYRVVDGGNARFELCLIMDETKAGIQAYFEYDTDIFSAQAVARVAHEYMAVIRHGIKHPDTTLELLRESRVQEEAQERQADKRVKKLPKMRRIAATRTPRKEAS